MVRTRITALNLRARDGHKGDLSPGVGPGFPLQGGGLGWQELREEGTGVQWTQPCGHSESVACV